MIRHMHASIKRSFHILTQQNHDALNNFPTEWTKLVTTEFNVKCSRKQTQLFVLYVSAGSRQQIVASRDIKYILFVIFASFALEDFWTYSSLLLFCLPTPPIYICTIYSWAYCGVALLLVQ